MRSAEECIAKSVELSHTAAQCSFLAIEYLSLAEGWLDLSARAERQDRLQGVENTPRPPEQGERI